jgi:hypothetical protein
MGPMKTNRRTEQGFRFLPTLFRVPLIFLGGGWTFRRGSMRIGIRQLMVSEVGVVIYGYGRSIFN